MECKTCRGTNFEIRDGLYFCEECGAQKRNLEEMEHDDFKMMTTYGSRLKAEGKSVKSDLKSRRLTSFEEYNHILIGLIDEILCIENIPNFKVTCLQLWISYLQKTEAAFFDKEQNSAPKLFARYREADAQILYNKKPKQKKVFKKRKTQVEDKFLSSTQLDRRNRKKARVSEKILSQQLSESERSESFLSSSIANLSIETIISDHENAELDIEYSRVGVKTLKKAKRRMKKRKRKTLVYSDQIPNPKTTILHLTGYTLLCIIYCALNICESNIQLSDLVRFVREGHVKYFKCKELLPEELLDLGVPLSFQEGHSYHMVGYSQLREKVAYFTKFIPDLRSSIKLPNLINLCHRYVDEMALPKDFKQQVERLMLWLPPVMTFKRNALLIPNYEGRAMAFIIFTLKLLFGLDGYREEQMSKAARRINDALSNSTDHKKLFVYSDWREFIEYRQVILEKYHYPMVFNHSYSNDKPCAAYNSMLDSINPPATESFDVKDKRKTLKSQLEQQLAVFRFDYQATNPMGSVAFHSSFYPFRDNFQRILNSDETVKASADFTQHVCEPYLRPQSFIKSCENVGVTISTKTSTFPKFFFLTKPISAPKFIVRESFELKHRSLNEYEWREDLMKRRAHEKKLRAKEELKFHKKRLSSVLEKRSMWRSSIRKRPKNPDKSASRSMDTSLDDQPKSFHEENVLSDCDSDSNFSDTDELTFDDSIAPELQMAIESRLQRDEQLTLITPDYNVWQRSSSIFQRDPKQNKDELDKLPPNFRWLLNFCADILHQNPILVYYELLCIEQQFMNVYQPVELIENVMTKQVYDQKVCKLLRNIEKAW